MSIPTLWIMVGLPAAGKSTVAKKIAEENDTVIISTDEIRAEVCDGDINDQSKNADVFSIFYKRIQENIENGINVIADATSVSIKSRRRIIECVGSMLCHKIAFIIAKDIQDCINDNLHREHPAPEETIIRMWRNFQTPFYEKGFNDIVIFNMRESKYISKQFVDDCFNQMRGFNQDNPHHTMDLYGHSELTTYVMSKEVGGPLPEWLHYGSMLHDIGKMFTKKFDDYGIAHYYSHESVGTYYLLCHWNEFNMFRTEEFMNMLFLVNYHMFPADWKSEKTIRKWLNIFGEKKFHLLKLFHECDQAR